MKEWWEERSGMIKDEREMKEMMKDEKGTKGTMKMKEWWKGDGKTIWKNEIKWSPKRNKIENKIAKKKKSPTKKKKEEKTVS